MGVFRAFGKLTTLVLLAGNVLLLMLIVLSGAVEKNPIDRLYWLQAETNGIPGAQHHESRWTFWGLCQNDDNHNANCTDLSPAYPLSPVDNFDAKNIDFSNAPEEQSIPQKFISDRDTFYYLSRFAFTFFWVALAFYGMSFLFYIFTWCSYSFTKVVFLMTSIGCLFGLAAVACQTAVTVMARNAFNDGHRSPKIGSALMGIAWASVVCSIFTFFGTGISFLQRAWTAHKEFVEMQNYREQALRYQDTKENPAFYDQSAAGVPPPAAVYDTPADIEQQHALQQPAAQPETRHSGVKFFKVRRNKNRHQTDEESI